jgi:phosphodiesterase/alkaline phosphatase D-like protein
MAGIAAASAIEVPAALAAELPNGVAAGDVTSRSGVLWARAAVPGIVKFHLAKNPGFAGGETYAVKAKDVTVPVKKTVRDLEPGTTYYYRATDAAGNSSVGRFRTAPEACADTGVRFGVSGDWRPELAPYPAIRNVPSRNLDFFIDHGDTIYAENYSDPSQPTAATLPEYRAKYAETMATRLGLNTRRDLRGSTAILATIDDHEVINDFAGGAPPATDPRFDDTGAYINETQRYRDGLKAFHDYMPIAEETYRKTGDTRTDGKPKLFRTRTYGNAATVIVLDNRSFRDTELPPVTNITDPAQVGAFLYASFDPSRTMLGAAQLSDLKASLLEAQGQGVVWKFVLTPEPAQNLGVLEASDRFEGYSYERAEILRFVDEQDIDNVVFVSADIHGTIVNNLTYQNAPFTAQIPSDTFEIVTGAVAFDAPFGQTVMGLAAQLGLVSPPLKAFYDLLPIWSVPGAPNDKNDILTAVINQVLQPYGYDPLGLVNSGLDATLVSGDYTSAHTYGWTEFEVDADTKALRVVTYGIAPYTAADLANDPGGVAAQQPQVVQEFRVTPVLAAVLANRHGGCDHLE